MYTQCPECNVAFRVTAEVLKQAAGKVRCGGCGVAFNALMHLSEELPVSTAPASSAPDAPGLIADTVDDQDGSTRQKSISAEQSAALLKTLDELSGDDDDIRIEDTGIEWRVLDVDEIEEAEDGIQVEENAFDDDGFDDDATPTIAHEEMRFDDNTPLPEDFDLEVASAPATGPEQDIEPAEPLRSIEESQVDLAFGEPDEWEDLLDDLEEAAVAARDAEEPVADELAALPNIEEIEAAVADDSSSSQPLDMDTQFAIQAEAMGIDLSGMHAKPGTEADAEAKEEAEPETAESEETSIDDDLIAAAFEVEAAAKTQASLAELQLLDDQEPEVVAEDVEEEAELEEVAEPEEEAELEEAAKLEEELADLAAEDLSRAGILDEDDYLEVISEDVVEDEVEDDVAAAPTEEEIEAELELAFEGFVADSDGFDDVLEDFVAPEVIEVPEPTEEEMTINMQIDQELLAIAAEDDDGFTSTIVQRQLSDNDDFPNERDAADTGLDHILDPAKYSAQQPSARSNPVVETIIMEGDSAHSEEELERRSADRRAATASLKESGFNADNDDDHHWAPPRYGMIAAAVLLFIVLGFQVIHHSREAFATSETFQNTLGPIYRMVGRPVTPAWDVKGWRFEATKGSASEEDEVLTIFSRIGNTSGQALPYPLVHVSLTDRFEEIIGSRVLEPAEYLVGNADPRRPVRQGTSFEAVFTIDTPSAAATGFKLNVCYRLSSGQLRCADDNFK